MCLHASAGSLRLWGGHAELVRLSLARISGHLQTPFDSELPFFLLFICNYSTSSVDVYLPVHYCNTKPLCLLRANKLL